mmetsp:Transcript_5131/g.7214  ORF Transcript_5131/g.7214 Transcript_5131/m.7214 type:complete len:571 (-) Transcript_5131:49-1761(-)
MFGFLVSFLLIGECLALEFNGPRSASVFQDQHGKLAIKSVYDPSGIAFGKFTDAKQNPSFFGELSIETNPNFDDEVQALAAGFLEGYLTHERVLQQYDNMKCQVNCSGSPGPNSPLYQWFQKQDEWLAEKIKEDRADPVIAYVNLLRKQQQGLYEGYNTAAEDKDQLPWWSFILLNGIGDIFDIKPAVDPTKRPNITEMSHEDLHRYRINNGHCSALVKVTGDLSEMFMGHSSWFTYSAMLRIYKHYHFNYKGVRVANRAMSFSSYPGMLSSLDDFYEMHDSKMVMLQTTNSVLDPAQFEKVTYRGLLAWHRVITANALASSGKEWSDIIDHYNSGTYNNQYMVVNVKLFEPTNALKDNLLWVVEQVPGLVVGGDVTEELRRGYWPSYNVPYWEKTYNLSGYYAVDQKEGQSYGSQYELAPRAKIFRRDNGNVKDFESYKAILRYNDFKNDPYSGGSPFGAICSRGDLSSSRPSAGGCYDTKATSASMFVKEGKASVINGPSVSGGVLPPFSWDAFPDTPHEGMPSLYNFTFQDFTVPMWKYNSKHRNAENTFVPTTLHAWKLASAHLEN